METNKNVSFETYKISKQGQGNSQPLSNSSDLEIWRKFKQGNEEAFICIYKDYFNLLFRYGHQFSKDSGLVEDCIQELFIDLRAKRQNLAEVTSIKYYLYKSLRSKIIRSLSRQNRFKFSDNLLDGYNFQINLNQEMVLINSEIDDNTRQALKASFNSLTPRQREIIIYYFYEKLTYQEISEIMNLSKVKYSRDLLYRAIDKLKEELKDFKPNLFYTFILLYFHY
ncbi:RNA polymerase sigma factor [Flexithrix dorotheae]|uniref:RNA polymerase sigma factor n=1 Tax=Flexithrix dorotheae TaxID=70993 RepID=UPI00036710AF|nr:sigma-70 family RNA polymerase sigma factor [Flexithrix dorotheae]